jgi:hypothetical protein
VAAAGALFGVSDVAIRWLTQAAPGPLIGVVSPWTLTAMIAEAIAFYASARSLQIGEGVEVIALTSVASNLVAIIGGILVFRARVLPRHRLRGAHARPDARHPDAARTPSRATSFGDPA